MNCTQELDKLIIVSDFDGTIAEQDVNEKIINTFGDQQSSQIEKTYIEGKIGDREALKKHYDRINISEEEFAEFVTSEITIDPYFINFYKLLEKYNIDFTIVSGGFYNYIKLLLNQNNHLIDYPVYANKLVFQGQKAIPQFFHQLNGCRREYGVCGVCKYKVIKDYLDAGKKVIYIGDGLTDRCVVDLSDILFAKKGKSLEKYCLQNKIDYKIFKSFKEIFLFLKEEILRCSI